MTLLLPVLHKTSKTVELLAAFEPTGHNRAASSPVFKSVLIGESAAAPVALELEVLEGLLHKPID